MQTGQQSGSRRVAARTGAVVLGEIDRLFGKLIEIGCQGLLVARQGLRPVVQVIDGDKQYIGVLEQLSSCGRSCFW